MAFTFIMQNIAANLGGCLTPFGNPQNLYLYSFFNIQNGEFVKIMLPTFIVSVLLITICCLCVKNEHVKLTTEEKKLSKKSIIYGILFVICILMIFRLIPPIVCLILIPIVIFFMDKKALKDVDYPLLLTFVFFFIFAGNVARIDAVKDFFVPLVEKNTLLFSSLSCQCISNVPSAILLSQFTNNYPELLVGVNIGGAGTLIASLASLITFKEYTKHNKGKSTKYIVLFSVFNFSFLAILLLINSIIL
jgi:Na+/H+ antiporter NhaD/arsenite permease-like protein